MNDLRILADDLTGALDSGAAFAGDVPVYLDAPDPQASAAFRVAVVATGTRDVAIEALPRLLTPSLPWLIAGRLAFKKVDSLLRGNTFAECAFVARAGGFSNLVFAPAFPGQGRVTIDGRHWVVPPGKSLADRQPVGAGAPADAFAVLGLAVAAPGETRGDQPAVWLPDIADDDDLARVAALSTQDRTKAWLWCGSAGLAHAIAACLGLAPDPACVALLRAGAGPVLVISASHHPVLRQQWRRLRTVRNGAITTFDLSPARVMAPPQAATLLAAQLAQAVREFPRPAALLVVGGDTLRALCHAAGTRTLMARASVRAGWGCARLVGGTWDGVPCYSRSGAFGAPDDLATMLRRVVESTATATQSAKETCQ